MAQWDKAVIDLGSDTLIADIRVQRISEVQGRCPLGQGLDVAFRGENEYLRGEQV